MVTYFLSARNCWGTLRWFFLVFLLSLLHENALAVTWGLVGPDGGDARSLTYDPSNPDRILLGTSSGAIFQSIDRGHSWEHLTRLSTGDNLVIDHLIIDPVNSNNIYAGAWSLESHHAGELFRSQDSGRTWHSVPAMHGRSIRAMAIAASDTRLLLVGALDGVFRSNDAGRTWRKISQRYTHIRDVESIAVDPNNPDVIYAGTWHLAWKTTDGGLTWRCIQAGMIDDSDVFSIILDESNTQTVYASACSGIYKSSSGGTEFDRVEGVPFSARRTRILKQDPNNPNIVYAGTTEGLWVTRDSGLRWNRVTSPDLVVNDILIDPRDSGRVLLATDRAGILASKGPELSFVASNAGFSHRYISSILPPAGKSDLLYIGLANDRDLGGVFASADNGQHWVSKSAGLNGRDVFVLKRTFDGTILAGTNQGLFAMDENGLAWRPLGNSTEPNYIESSGQAIISTARVNDIEITTDGWFAATTNGFFNSSDQGKSWTKSAPLGTQNFISIHAGGTFIVLATSRKLLVSRDHGTHWRVLHTLPRPVHTIHTIAMSPDGQLFIGSDHGAFRRQRSGRDWVRMRIGLPTSAVSCLTYSGNRHRLLAASAESTYIFESTDDGRRWHLYSDTGYPLRLLVALGDRIMAVTRFDGLILQGGDSDY